MVYTQMGCDGMLLTIKEASKAYPDYADLQKIAADKVYFASNHGVDFSISHLLIKF